MITIGRIASKLSAVAAVFAVSALVASPANALDNNAPNLTVGGYGVSVGADVYCDKATRTMTVNERTSTMQSSGPSGPVAGPYDAGQWVRYNVWARETAAASYTQIYSWSQWRYISTVTSTPYVERLEIPAELGTNRVTGAAGHNYQVIVQIDWWTGKDNIANITPSYSQILKTSPYTTYYLEPSKCVF